MRKLLNNINNFERNYYKKLLRILVIIFFLSQASLFSQMVNDFIIADSGSVPSINSDFNGGIFVTWQKLKDAIYLKHIGPDGNTIGNEIKFSNTFASISPQISVRLKNILVVWNDKLSNIVNPLKSYIIGNISPQNNLDTNAYVVFNNNLVSNEMRGLPNANFLNDTLFVVVWNGNGDSTITNYGIYGQLASTTNIKIGDNFLVTDHYRNNIENYYPKIIKPKQDDYFFVTWEDNESGRFNIYGRKFNLNGTPLGSSFLISNDTAMTYMYYYSVAKDTSGNFVVVWFADKGNKSQMEWRWYNSKGSPSTNVEQLTSLDSVFSSGSTVYVSINRKGKIIIEWEQVTSSGIKIFGQRYLANRSKLGKPFRVSTSNASGNEIYANVVLRNDTIFSVWQEGKSIKGNILDFNNITSISSNLSANKITTYTLFQNYPNPFNPTTTLKFKINISSNVTLSVFNILGQREKVIFEGYLLPGMYYYNWNGKNSRNRELSTGIYFIKLKVNKNFSVKKIELLK